MLLRNARSASELFCLVAAGGLLAYGFYSNGVANKSFFENRGSLPGRSSGSGPASRFGPAVENHAFKPGEKLTYVVHYKGMTVGHSTLAVEAGPEVNGAPTIQFVSTARSRPFFDTFFKVRDFNRSVVDQATLIPHVFHQNLREGRYRAVRDLAIDHRSRKFEYSEMARGKSFKKSGEIDEPLFDVLGSIFYARTLPLKPGREMTIPIFRKGKRISIPVTVRQEKKTIETPAGKFECILIEPGIKGDSIMRSKDGRLFIWMTDDERRLPIAIEARVGVGLVTARLESMEGTGNLSHGPITAFTR